MTILFAATPIPDPANTQPPPFLAIAICYACVGKCGCLLFRHFSLGSKRPRTGTCAFTLKWLQALWLPFVAVRCGTTCLKQPLYNQHPKILQLTANRTGGRSHRHKCVNLLSQLPLMDSSTTLIPLRRHHVPRRRFAARPRGR